jgi:hypothetical protein
MKIICDNQEEYDEFIKTSKYLHDFMIRRNDVKKWGKDISGEGLDFDKYPLLNTIVGLYLGKEDNPQKDEILQIKKRK